MKDLTKGRIAKHLVAMAVPIAIGMVFQTLYYLVDLYFVGLNGDVALAGVSAAGPVAFVMLALTQVLAAGTVALVSQALGRNDRSATNLAFNQAMVLSVFCGFMTLICSYALAGPFMHVVAAGPAAIAGTTYLHWYAPGLALQFATIAMGAALRGTGIVQPVMLIQMLTVILNTVLAPVLIAGWVTHAPLGVAGAGLASTIAIAAGVVLLWLYFAKREHQLTLEPEQWRPHLPTLKSLLNIGLPAGGEFFMLFVIMATILWGIRDFGSVAQAGFGVSYRVMQAIFLPVLAIALGSAPVVGQNFGARDAARVRETFRTTTLLSAGFMLLATALCQSLPELFVSAFTHEKGVIAVGVTYLRVVSWSFVASAVIFSCSSVFQGIGNTWPALASAALRLVTFVLPVCWLSAQPNRQLKDIWYVSVASLAIQALSSVVLLQAQFRKRLAPMISEPPPATAGLPTTN